MARWRSLGVIAIVIASACTSDGPQSASTTTVAPPEQEDITTSTSTPPEPLPLPADTDLVRVGETYVIELWDHCNFYSLTEIAGTNWVVRPPEDNPGGRYLREMLEGEVPRGSFGVIGELHYASPDEMVFSVPGSRFSARYEPTDQAVPCF